MHMRTPSSPPHSGILVPRGKLLFNLVPQQPARDRANMSSKNASNCRVVVVGGGIIGLTAALALLERGFRNVKIVAKAFDATTSHVAGGLWMPFELPSHVDPTTPRKWCEVSYAWLEKMAELHGHDATGLHKVEAIDVSAEGEPLTTAPYWGHVVENYKILNGREASAVFPGMTHGASFRTIIYNTTTFMELVTREVRKLGGVLEQREITSLDDVDCDLLINCSGLAAKQLANDDTVYPIRGQVIKVYNPRITKCVMAVDANSVHTYIIPRPNGDVVLGGTVQPNNWNASSNDADADAVWERCCKLYPEVKSSRVMARVAGLRPGRADGVRLEADARPTARGAFVIHNYGHSGSGHTLQWGCAQDVVELAAKKFPVVNSSKL